MVLLWKGGRERRVEGGRERRVEAERGKERREKCSSKATVTHILDSPRGSMKTCTTLPWTHDPALICFDFRVLLYPLEGSGGNFC